MATKRTGSPERATPAQKTKAPAKRASRKKAPKKMGRPRVLDTEPATIDRFFEYLGPLPFDTAASMAGLDARQARRWLADAGKLLRRLERGKVDTAELTDSDLNALDFHQRVVRAHADFHHTLVKALTDSGDWRASKFLLERRFGDVYRPRSTVEVDETEAVRKARALEHLNGIRRNPVKRRALAELLRGARDDD